MKKKEKPTETVGKGGQTVIKPEQGSGDKAPGNAPDNDIVEEETNG